MTCDVTTALDLSGGYEPFIMIRGIDMYNSNSIVF